MLSYVAIIIFLLSASAIAYVVIFYPLVLAWMVRRTGGKPIHKEFQERTVTILLPVHNGEPWLRLKLESILALDYPAHLVNTIVVSDGSTDGTEDIARSFALGARVEVVSLAKGGKAQCLNAGLARAKGEILFYTDVRQTLAPESLRNLVSCFADPAVGVVSGELIIREGSSLEEMNVGIYWQYEKWIRRNLSAVDSVPGATGAIYAMRRELARPMPAYTLLDDVYLPMSAFLAGYRIVFEESAKAYDEPATLAIEFRRKVRTLAGVYQLVCVCPALLGPRNRMWAHFVSHKLGRLLLPFALLAILVSSFWLPPILRTIVLAGQAIFYGMAIIDILVPESLPLKRVSSAAWTFVVLMAASLCAVSFFFLPAQSFWKPTRNPSANMTAE
jgi:biofilm PGA synthesis N-glycosyltransferase PgaC